METFTATEILELLGNTEKISSVSAYGTKLVAHKTITGRLDIQNKRIKETVTFLNCAFEDLTIDNTHCDDSIEFLDNARFQKILE